MVAMATVLTSAPIQAAASQYPRRETSWWETALTYVLAAAMIGLAAGIFSRRRRQRIRAAIASGRLMAEHIRALVVVADRYAKGDQTGSKHLMAALGVEKEVAQRLLKELRKFGCVTSGGLVGVKPLGTGLELLESADQAQVVDATADARAWEETVQRASRVAAAASVVGVAGPDGGGG